MWQSWGTNYTCNNGHFQNWNHFLLFVPFIVSVFVQHGRTKAVTSRLFTPLFMFIHLPLIHFPHPPRLLIDFKNSKWLTYFCILYYVLLYICYCFSQMIGLLSVTWLFLLYKFTRFFIYFLFLSDEEPTLETLEYILSGVLGYIQTDTSKYYRSNSTSIYTTFRYWINVSSSTMQQKCAEERRAFPKKVCPRYGCSNRYFLIFLYKKNTACVLSLVSPSLIDNAIYCFKYFTVINIHFVTAIRAFSIRVIYLTVDEIVSSDANL